MAALLAPLAVFAPAMAQGDGLGLLGRLQPGQWTVTPRDGGSGRKLCLGDPAQLVQLRHSRHACTRYTVEEDAGRVTVHYTCKGNGYGRTSIRRETDQLVQIESQGFARGRPFQFRAEARRTGACR